MVNVLRQYNRMLRYGVKYNWYKFHPAISYWTNIHPHSESQFKAQRFLAGVNPWYGSWMESRSMDERNRVTRKQYGLRFGDITYPWLSGLTSANESRSIGSGSWSFSRNMSRLYR